VAVATIALACAQSAESEANVTAGALPFSAMGCVNSRAGDGNWVFTPASGVWNSCNMPIRGDGASMCIDWNGQTDFTSIFVDLASVRYKPGCYAWYTPACTFDLRRVHQITFEVDLHNCQGVWAAPLWLSPTPWTGPAWYSGEIDLVELCPRGAVATNFGAAGGAGESQMTWGSAQGLNGARKYTMTLDHNSGSLSTQICRLDGSGCFNGAHYNNFLNEAHSTRGKAHSDPYHLAVDIWNGYGGDGGWYGCHAQNDPNSQCQFAVRNIKIHTFDGSPMWGGGKCAALNGYWKEFPRNETVVMV